MTRTDTERLHEALAHLDRAMAYAETESLDQKTIDAISMRIAAGIDARTIAATVATDLPAIRSRVVGYLGD